MRVKACVGVREQTVVDQSHGWEASQPLDVDLGKSLQIAHDTAIGQPIFQERASTTGRRPARKPMRRQDKWLMVSQQGLHTATRPHRLTLQPHDELDDSNAVRTTIKEVSHEP